MANKVEFQISAVYDEKSGGFKSAIKDAEAFNKQQTVFQTQATRSSGKAVMLADSVGKVSTTLARSVGIFGLSSTSLRAIDDAADIAELGLRGVEGGFNSAVTGANLFSAATIGMVGAAAALGVGLGTLLRKLGETEFGMNVLGLSTKALDADIRRLFGVIEAGPDKTFTAGMASEFDEATKSQIESLRAAGATIDDIARSSGEALKKLLGPMGENEKISKLKELGFSTAEITKLIPALTDNLKGEADAQRLAAGASNQHAEELKRLSEAAFAFLEKQALSASMEAEEAALKAVDEEVKRLEEDFKSLEDAALDAAMAGEEWELEQAAKEAEEAVRGLEEELKAAKEEAERLAEVKLDTFLEGMVNFAALLGEAWGRVGEIVAGTIKQISEAKTGFEKFAAISRGVGALGGMLGGKTGGFLGGAASGAMMGAALGSIIPGLGTVVGGVIGGVVGGIAGIIKGGKEAKKKLEEQKVQLIQVFGDMFGQWQQLRSEIADAGAEGVNKLVDSLFEDGKFTGEFTSAANAATYVAAQFQALRASGLSVSQALSKMGPALTAMGKDAAQFAGTAAAPLIQMSNFVTANEKLVAFTEGLGATAISLASFGLLTQDIASKLSADLGASIDKMIGKGLSYEQALGLSAQTLFDLQQAAKQSGTVLDAHTQKMVDDAAAAGLFEGLQDPMQKLIELQGAMVAAMGQLISLMGGAVPAAIQKMIDEFNNAQININVNVDVPNQDQLTQPPDIPNKPPPPPFQHGGFIPESQSGQVIRVAERGTGGEYMIPANQMDEMQGSVTVNVYALPHQNERQIAEEANRLVRLNRRGRLSQAGLGHR